MTVQKKLDFVEETLNHLKKVRNKTKDNDPTSKLNQLISNMENPNKLNAGEKIYIPKFVLKRAKEPIVLA